MSKIEKLKKRFEDYKFDHPIFKTSLEWIISLTAVVFSAFIFAFGFRAFIATTGTGHSLVSGGVSGLSQTVVKIIELLNINGSLDTNTLQSIFFFLLNIPVLILGWFGVGKRFTILSLINVACVSLFMQIIPGSVADFLNLGDEYLPRALFGGICTAISSVAAFKVDASAGGIDVISMYFANKKSTSVGKYFIIFNGLIIFSYTIITYFETRQPSAITSCLYTLIYLFTNATVTDMLNVRNKKAQVQIITSRENMANILIANFPHGCTVVPAKGAFSKEERQILYMVVSLFEVKKVVKLVKMADPNAFVNVASLRQVYGKFYIKPMK